MTLITLGISGSTGHDAAAAIFIDGELVAAVEEERLMRRRHAEGFLPYQAVRQCLLQAQVKPTDIDIVAIPYAPVSLFNKARWHYAYRHWYALDRSLDVLFNGNRRYRRHIRELNTFLESLHIPLSKLKIVPVQHQLAHASSSYHLSGSEGKTAILGLDTKGEYATIFLGYGEAGKIHRIKEFYDPDSLSGMYAAISDYLGFDILDGEFKVMGIAPLGDATKYDFSYLAKFSKGKFKIDNQLIGTVGFRRYKAKSRGHYFSQKLLDRLGPRREGNLTDEPYVHYAAAIQKCFEDYAIELVRYYLSDVLKDTGTLAIAGTSSLNIRLNQRLAELPEVKRLIVHPGCGDSGTAIGAAAYAVHKRKQKISALESVFLGPSYSTEQCIYACENHREKSRWEKLDNAPLKAAQLLADGELLAWFQGKMEFGPRALGNRSILANPAKQEVVDLLNKQLKFRESWRSFSPSVLDSFAGEFLEGPWDYYMCSSVKVAAKWREKYASVVYADGCTRAQVVSAKSNPRFHQLLKHFETISGHSLVVNTTLCRPGEALICSPEDAMNMFHGSDLKYLIMEDVLISKTEEVDSW
ncbi:MAG: carbamoyltransferase [SAR86 cluster bacterium]|uniref:Carbamoyltransferase n=1 Tax=SAR86 cluster bacterium TaxID=2030880 RepID=A0A2A4MTU1_9GAMM|nr:MAG: carbamoyltransferase [SAR86 cluster bacterium]